MSLSGCLHAERLVGPAVIVKVDPVTDYPHRVLQRFEAMAMDALRF